MAKLRIPIHEHSRLALVFLPIAFLAAGLVGCRHRLPVDPTPKDPRVYTWTVDTLEYPGSFQTMMRSMWASSARDIYLVGHNDQSLGEMYHYNGQRWAPVPLIAAEGGPLPNGIHLSAVFGFSPADVYAVGRRWDQIGLTDSISDSTLVLHFNGVQWAELPFRHWGYLGTVAGRIAGRELATGGWGMELILFDGVSWRWDSVRVAVPQGGFFQLNALAIASGGVTYALGNTHENALGRDTYYFFRRQTPGGWQTVDSVLISGPSPNGFGQELWGYYGLWAAPWGKLYSLGGCLYERTGQSWTSLFDNQHDLLTRLYGTSEKNIFLVGHFGKIFHYNGTNWYQFTQFARPDLALSDVWTDGREVFVLGNDGRKTFVLHGR